MKKFILMAAVGILMSLGVNAQKQGYVNVRQLLYSLPAYEKAGKDLEAYRNTFQETYSTMEKDFKTKIETFTKEEKTMTPAVREVRGIELQGLEKKMMEFQETSMEKIEKKQEELLAPINETIMKAIKDYADANKYDFIFNSDGLLYAKDSDNLTKALITQMGGKQDASSPAIKAK